MVGWGFAFGRGFVIFLWSIVWGIIGGIIAVAITGGSFVVAFTNPKSFVNNPGPLIAAIFLGIFVGVLVSSIGVYASIVKVTMDGMQRLQNVPEWDRMIRRSPMPEQTQ